MVVNHQLYKKDIFFPDWSPSPFLVLIVEFFLKTKKKQVFLQKGVAYLIFCCNIGINKIDQLLRQPNCPFVLYVGAKRLVKRKEFEEYLNKMLTI